MSTQAAPAAHPAPPALTLGAYALTPQEPDEAAQFVGGLGDLGVDLVEHPLMAPGHSACDPEHVAATLPDGVDLVVTCIPRTMQRLGADARYGLASSDADGRAAALADLAEVAAFARRLADLSGRPRVRAVEVHTAPAPWTASSRGVLGSRDAMLASLAEAARLDLTGAALTIEHCDALVPDHEPVKGFWSIDDEIALATETGVSVSLNWGRSALEERDAAAPERHAARAAAAGVLGGVIFSGAVDVAGDWGPAWDDTHAAPAGDDPALAPSSASLLTLDRMAATLRAAGPGLAYVGAKVTAAPGTDVAGRLDVARATLALVRTALAEAAAR